MTKLAMPFNNPSTYKDHSGVDYGQPAGAKIMASGNGSIYFSGWLNANAGWSVIVDYGNTLVLYCHQPEGAYRPRSGAFVFNGTQIGSVGSSGRSTGPHLHMEIMRGEGAHTYEGIWNYFDKTKTIGQGSTSGSTTENYYEEEDMFIANVKGSFYLVQTVKGVPTGHALHKNSEARASGVPIINYPDDWAVSQLRKTTTLLA